MNQKRQDVNAWLSFDRGQTGGLTSSSTSTPLDHDRPAQPASDSGDHLHPGDRGTPPWRPSDGRFSAPDGR